MMRRELVDYMTVGATRRVVPTLFDESLPACEDYDLWLRVSAKFPIYLIDEPLITKYGGHADQLSRTVSNLDKYRIQALEKILDRRGDSTSRPYDLNQDQRQLAFKELKRKCLVYANGCMKRGKFEEGQKYFEKINPAGDPLSLVAVKTS